MEKEEDGRRSKLEANCILEMGDRSECYKKFWQRRYKADHPKTERRLTYRYERGKELPATLLASEDQQRRIVFLGCSRNQESLSLT